MCACNADPPGTIPIIRTVAGNGQLGYMGDGKPATQGPLGDPYIVTVDDAGNFWAAQHDPWFIRKINSNGTISTYAGNGQWGKGGDGGLATSAQVAAGSMDVDANGDMYILNSKWTHYINAINIT